MTGTRYTFPSFKEQLAYVGCRSLQEYMHTSIPLAAPPPVTSETPMKRFYVTRRLSNVFTDNNPFETVEAATVEAVRLVGTSDEPRYVVEVIIRVDPPSKAARVTRLK